jgi:excisionase family DNA binding protein
MTSRLLTLEQAAEQLAVSTRTLRRWIASGAIPAFRHGRIVRVREIDLHRFISERMAMPAAGWQPDLHHLGGSANVALPLPLQTTARGGHDDD